MSEHDHPWYGVISVVLAAALLILILMSANFDDERHREARDRLAALETPVAERQLPSNLPGN